MGTSVITIRIVGNHGCQRDVKNGGTVNVRCEKCDDEQAAHCVDAVAREFVEKLKNTGQVVEAGLLHWPEAAPHIYDDLVTGQRSGDF